MQSAHAEHFALSLQLQYSLNVLSLHETIISQFKDVLDVLDVGVEDDTDLTPLLNIAPVHDIWL